MFEDELQEHSDIWFGTGLRAHLGITPETDEAVPTGRPETSIPILRTDESGDADQRARQLEAYQRDLVQQARWLQVREAELAESSRRLEDESRRLEQEAQRLAEQSKPKAKQKTKQQATGRDARTLLRQLAEEHVDRIAQVFEEALEATMPDGTPDLGTRLTTARALLAEAYGEPARDVSTTADPQTLEDELADLRQRRGAAG